MSEPPVLTPALELALDLAHARALGPTDPLVRAVGHKKGTTTVVDATAGLGRDAVALARLGLSVIAIERVPQIAALWREAIGAAPWTLSFLEADAKDALLSFQACGFRPDVVTLDPMYPHGKRRGAPQKEMVLLRELAGDDDDAAQLLETALKVALLRVVVKRPRKAPPLLPGVSHAWDGASTRYDLYLTSRI